MKTFVILVTALMLTVVAVPSHCFIEYLFGGSATTDSIGNNVVGDLRAWWTGNPVYNFNPYYSGANPGPQANAPTQPGQNMNPMGSAGPQYQNQQPSVTYYPPQGQQPYGYAQQQGQPMQQQFQPAPQGYETQQAPPQAYYQGPQQQYQGPQQQYQGPQAYQGMPQGYEQAPPGYYQGQPGGRYQNYQYEQEIPQEQ